MALIVPTSSGTNLAGWQTLVANALNALIRKRLIETTITAATTLTDDYDVYLCDASGAAFTVTLPKAELYTGKLYYLKKVDSSANAVTIDGDGAETIDGATTQSLANQYQTITLFSNGTDWNVVPVSPTLGTVSVTNPVTFASSGGATAGTDYDGSAAVTVDYSTVGAVPTTRQLTSTDGTIDGVGALSGDLNLSADEQAILDAISSTQGAILYRGASAWAALAPGTSGQFLKTLGAGADPAWAAASGGGGSLVLLEQHTASSSTDLQFTTALTSTYDTYVIEFVGVVPATNGVFLYMQASTNGGTSYDSSGLYSWAVNYTNSAGSVSNPSGGETDTKLEIFGTVSSAATGGLSGTAYFYHPASTTLHKQIHTVGVAYVNDSRFYRFNSAGAYRNATAVNALRFYFSSGNIASGTIRIYGVVK